MKRRRGTRAVFVIPAVAAVIGILLVAGVSGFWLISHRAAEPEKKKPDELLMEY